MCAAFARGIAHGTFIPWFGVASPHLAFPPRIRMSPFRSYTGLPIKNFFCFSFAQNERVYPIGQFNVPFLTRQKNT